LAATAVEPSRKHRDDLQHIVGQFFLEAGIVALVDDDDFDLPGLAQGKYEFRPEAQQAILVGEDKGSPDIPSLAWGRFKDAQDGTRGRLQLPFSVQAHHGFVDGFHIHQLAQQIAAELDRFMQ